MTEDVIENDELLEELELTRTQEGILDELQALYSNIWERMEVGRTHMATLEAISEGSLPELYPLASFTEIPSQTNLNVALESVLRSIGSALAALVKAIVSMFRKIISRLLALFLMKGSTVKKTEERLEASQELEKELNQVKRKFEEPVKSNADRVMKEAEVTFVEEKKEKITLLMVDVIEYGPLRKKMVETGRLFEDQFVLATKRIEVLRSVLKELSRLKQKDLEAEHDIKKLELRSQLATVIAKNDAMSSAAFLERIESLYNDISKANNTAPSKVTARDLDRWLKHGSIKNIDFIPKRLDIEAKSKEIDKVLRELEQAQVKVEDKDLARDLQEALRSVRATLVAFSYFDTCASTMSDARTDMLKVLINFAENRFKALATYTYNEGSDKDKELIGKVVKSHRKRVT